MIQPGTHRVTVRDHYLSKSKNAGTPFIGIVFEEAEGDNPDTITWFGYITEKTAERLVATLEGLGWTGNDITTLGQPPTDDQVGDRNIDLRGAECEIVVESEIYNEKTQVKVKWINTPGSATAKTFGDALSSAEMKDITKLVKAHKGKAPEAASKF